MISLCFIGDSHLAALKYAWPLVEDDFPDINIDFFGAGFRRMQYLAVRNGMLVGDGELGRALAYSSGKEAQIDGDYDAYVVYGLALRIFHAKPLYSVFRAECHKEDTRTPISDDCFLRAMAGIVRTSAAVELLPKLRQITQAPVTLLATPMVAQSERDENRPKALPDHTATAEFFTAACTNIAAAHGCTFLPQAPETLAGPLRTIAHYALSPARFRFDDAEPDHNHMNAEFGTVALRYMLPHMRALALGQAPSASEADEGAVRRAEPRAGSPRG